MLVNKYIDDNQDKKKKNLTNIKALVTMKKSLEWFFLNLQNDKSLSWTVYLKFPIFGYSKQHAAQCNCWHPVRASI